MDNLLASSNLVMTKVQNIDFLDQRQPTSEVALQSQNISNQVPIGQTISEPEWQMSDLLTRYVLVDTLSWTTSQVQNTSLYNISYPSGLPNTFPQASILGFMTYLRAGVSFKFMINGTRFHQGRLLAAWYPAYRGTTALPSEFTNVNYMSCLPHVELAPDSGESVVLNVPYAQIHTMWSQFEAHSVGSLYVSVLNQLQTMGGSTSVNVSLYVKFIDPEVHVPVVPQNPVLKGTRRPNLNVLTHTPRDLTHLKPHGGFAKLGEAAASGAATIANFEGGNYAGAIGTGVTAIEKVIDGIGDILGGNFDKPNCKHEQEPFRRFMIGNPSSVVGKDTCVELGSYPNNAHVVPKAFISSSEDEMSIAHLISKPCYFGSFNWQGANASGELLEVLPTCPTYFFRQTTPVTNPRLIQPTWMAFVAENYSLWRGSFKFKLEFVGTSFHVGRLVVSFVPFQLASNAVLTLEQAVQSPHVVWDVRERHEIFVECPYNVTFPYLNCPTMYDWQLESGLYPLGDRLTNCSSGSLYIHVLNELTSSGDIVTNAQVNIWPLAGSDMEFHKQRGSYGFNQLTQYPSLTPPASFTRSLDNLVIQGETEEKETSETTSEKPDPLTNTPAKLAPSEVTHVLQKTDYTSLRPTYSFVGEADSHLKDLLRRSCVIAYRNQIEFPAATSTGIFGLLPTYKLVVPLCFNIEQQGINTSPAFTNPVSNVIYYKHPLTSFNSAFAFFAGKLCFKLVVKSLLAPALTVRIAHFQDEFAGGSETQPIAAGNTPKILSFGTYPQFETICGLQNAIDFSIPWAQPNSLALTNYTSVDYPTNSTSVSDSGLIELSEFSNGSLIIEIDAGGVQTTAQYVLYMSLGDDGILGYPTAPPPIILNAI